MKDGDDGHADRSANANLIRSADTMFTIVEHLKSVERGKVTEIAKKTGFSKGTVHKHLNTLVEHEFAVKEGAEYRLGLRFLELGGSVRFLHPSARFIKEKIRELAEETGEVAFYTTEEHGRPVVLYREMGEHGVPSRSHAGQRLYLHQIAAGKAILAEYSDDRVREIVADHGLPSATENTITDVDVLFDVLGTVRERGYALSVEEATVGLQAAAVAVPDGAGETLGACAVAGPAHRMDETYFEETIPKLLQNVANEMTLNIAYS